jgi:hypothetical protein
MDCYLDVEALEVRHLQVLLAQVSLRQVVVLGQKVVEAVPK